MRPARRAGVGLLGLAPGKVHDIVLDRLRRSLSGRKRVRSLLLVTGPSSEHVSQAKYQKRGDHRENEDIDEVQAFAHVCSCALVRETPAAGRVLLDLEPPSHYLRRRTAVRPVSFPCDIGCRA